MREKGKELRQIRGELLNSSLSAQYDEARVRALSDSAARVGHLAEGERPAETGPLEFNCQCFAYHCGVWRVS